MDPVAPNCERYHSIEWHHRLLFCLEQVYLAHMATYNTPGRLHGMEVAAYKLACTLV